MSPEAAAELRTEAAWDRPIGWCVFVCALLPALAAVWLVPWFVTQDGPAHLYNAEIIGASLDPGSAFRPYFAVRWQPLPNWAGHLLTAGLLTVLPPRTVDRLLMTFTLAGFAGAVVWLRLRVAGARGLWLAGLVGALLGLNVTWLFGFTSFLLGACLFPLTLGVWWTSRERLAWPRVALISALLVLGYFCHLVSLGLTVVGLAVLAVFTPGPGRAARGLRTALAAIPLVPLGLAYVSQSHQGGTMRPVWEHLQRPFSPAAWAQQLSAVDPITLARKGAIPLTGADSAWFGLMTPVLWLVAGLALIGVAVWQGRTRRADARRNPVRGWLALAALLVCGGLVGPDSLGSNHGDFLPLRLVLLGLVALVPALDLETVLRHDARRLGAIAGGILTCALVVQSALVWDYALTSRDRVGGLLRARDAIGQGQRVATLLNHFRCRFRVNPLVHADCLLGLETRSIIWSDYETRYYYFPVQFRAEVDRPPSLDLEVIWNTGDSDDVATRARAWEQLLAAHRRSIDVLLVWGTDPVLDPISARWFHTVFEEGKTRVLKPRASLAMGAPTRTTSSGGSAGTASSRSGGP